MVYVVEESTEKYRTEVKADTYEQALEMVKDHDCEFQPCGNICADTIGIELIEFEDKEVYSDKNVGERPPKFMKNMDWKLLKEQKQALLKIMSYEANNNLKPLNGLLGLVDTIQDYAVDIMGIEETQVFQFR